MNTAISSPPGPGQATAAEPGNRRNDNTRPRSGMPPGWAGLAGRVGEAIEQAIAAAPGGAAWSGMTLAPTAALPGSDKDLLDVPTWWLEWHARVEHADLDHRAEVATAATARACEPA